MKTMAENVAGACLFSMRIELNLRHNVQLNGFERFSGDSQKRIKTVVRTQIDRCVFDDNGNALMWTGP